MTPEERAAEVLFDYPYSPYTLEYHIATAIRAAVEAERERCAQIAESFVPSGFTGDGKAGNSYAVARDDRARTIAAMIRRQK